MGDIDPVLCSSEDTALSCPRIRKSSFRYPWVSLLGHKTVDHVSEERGGGLWEEREPACT